MSIENFLSNFEKKEKEQQEKHLLAEEAKIKKLAEEKEFYSQFDSLYVKKIVKEFRQISTLLKEKFTTEHAPTAISQQHHHYGYINLTPKFDSRVKGLTIQIQAQHLEKEILIFAKAIDKQGKEIKIKELYFHGEMNKFIELNLENLVGIVLDDIFNK